MKIVHYTTKDRIDKIFKEGLKVKSEYNLTEPLGINNNIIYEREFGNKGIYFSIEDENTTSPFLKESDYALTINLKETDLVADIQMLIDYGAVFDEEMKYFWFDTENMDTLNFIKEHDILTGDILISDALDSSSYVCDLLKDLTKSGVYVSDISRAAIQEIIPLNKKASYIGVFKNIENDKNGVEKIKLNEFLSITKLDELELRKIVGKNSHIVDRAVLIRKIDFFYDEAKNTAILYKKDQGKYYLFKTSKHNKIELNQNLKVKRKISKI